MATTDPSSSSLPLTTSVLKLKSPAEVRDYLVTVLTQKFQLERDQARAVASEWHYGTGKDLQSLDAAGYRGIFGQEIGSLLYIHQISSIEARIMKSMSIRSKDEPKVDEVIFKYREFSFIMSGTSVFFALLYTIALFNTKSRRNPEPAFIYIMTVLQVISTVGHLGPLLLSPAKSRVALTNGPIIGLFLLGLCHVVVAALAHLRLQPGQYPVSLLLLTICCISPLLHLFDTAPRGDQKRKSD